MAVPPQHVPARGRPAGIGHPGLGHQAVRPLRVPARRDLGLARRHLGQRAAQVHGHRLPAGRRGPRHRPGQGPVDLAHPRPVPEPAQRPQVARGQLPGGQLSQLAGRDVEQHHTSPRQLLDPVHPPAGLDPAAQLGQLRDHRVGQPGAAARHDRPARRCGPAAPAAGRTRRSAGRSAAASSAPPARPAGPGPPRCAPPGQPLTGSRPARPNRASRQRVRGAPPQRGQERSRPAARRPDQRPISRGRPAVAPERGRRLVHRTRDRGRRPPSRGWAKATSG